MELLTIVIFYMIAVILITWEGHNRAIGSMGFLLISLFLTPVVGVLVLFFAKKRISFHHYVKLKNEGMIDKSPSKTIHTNGGNKWVELKISELKPV